MILNEALSLSASAFNIFSVSLNDLYAQWFKYIELEGHVSVA